MSDVKAPVENNSQIVKKLSILVEVNYAISRTFDLKESLKATLKILQKSYRIKSGAIFLMEEDGRTLYMAESVGYRDELAKTKYVVGEGLTGRIAETGKPIVSPQVSKEPLFLNRMSSWDPDRDRELSFIGIPITLKYDTLIALPVNLPYIPKCD